MVEEEEKGVGKFDPVFSYSVGEDYKRLARAKQTRRNVSRRLIIPPVNSAARFLIIGVSMEWSARGVCIRFPVNSSVTSDPIFHNGESFFEGRFIIGGNGPFHKIVSFAPPTLPLWGSFDVEGS